MPGFLHSGYFLHLGRFLLLLRGQLSVRLFRLFRQNLQCTKTHRRFCFCVLQEEFAFLFGLRLLRLVQVVESIAGRSLDRTLQQNARRL